MTTTTTSIAEEDDTMTTTAARRHSNTPPPPLSKNRLHNHKEDHSNHKDDHNHNNNNKTTAAVVQKWVFRDWTDLQTRLMLIPLFEDQGVGAKVVSYVRDDGGDVDSSTDVAGGDGECVWSDYVLISAHLQQQQQLRRPCEDENDDDDTMEQSRRRCRLDQEDFATILQLLRSMGTCTTSSSSSTTAINEDASSSSSSMLVLVVVSPEYYYAETTQQQQQQPPFENHQTQQHPTTGEAVVSALSPPATTTTTTQQTPPFYHNNHTILLKDEEEEQGGEEKKSEEDSRSSTRSSCLRVVVDPIQDDPHNRAVVVQQQPLEKLQPPSHDDDNVDPSLLGLLTTRQQQQQQQQQSSRVPVVVEEIQSILTLSPPSSSTASQDDGSSTLPQTSASTGIAVLTATAITGTASSQQQQQQQSQHDTNTSTTTTTTGASSSLTSSMGVTSPLSLWTRRVSAAAAATAQSAAAAVRVAVTEHQQKQQQWTKDATTTAAPPQIPPQLVSPVASSSLVSEGANMTSSSPTSVEHHSPPPFAICMRHPETGEVQPLDANAQCLRPTNSSLLMIVQQRTAATTSPPLSSGATPEDAVAVVERFQYQWYKSNRQLVPANTPDNNHNMIDSNSSNDEWGILSGATTSTFQPTTTEIGYYLRCEIRQLVHSPTTNAVASLIDATSSDASHDDDAPTPAPATTAMLCQCDTPIAVAAAMPLFNGSRQALVRGAQFGGLIGRGHAAGRTFCIKVHISACSDHEYAQTTRQHRRRHNKRASNNAGTSCCALTIYQVSGATSEPMHPIDQPVRCLSAMADYNHGTYLTLIFPRNLPESAGMIAALCTEDNNEDGGAQHNSGAEHQLPYLQFQLQTPNRLARESILLAIGIANYQGKPSELNADTILYHPLPSSSVGATSSETDDGCSASFNDGDNLSIYSSSSSLSSSSMDSTPRREAGSLEAGIRLQRSVSLGAVLSSKMNDESHTVAVLDKLHHELSELRAKLVRKDKVISQLHRQVTQSDDSCRQMEHQLRRTEADLEQCHSENRSMEESVVIAQQEMESRDRELHRVQVDMTARNDALESDLQIQRERIIQLEKMNRTLQNDNDVLSAAVEAREVKLAKMADVQASLNVASAQLAQQTEFQKELDEANQRYLNAKEEIERLRLSNSAHVEEMNLSRDQITSLEQQLQAESAKTATHQSELDKEQMKIQKLKAERNSYKQKGDSLAKEMNRICRNGRTVRDVEKILADEVTRREEVQVLREQKRTALEQMEYYRTAYEQSRSVQKLAGLDHDAGKILERNAELERLLSELTEYLNAKEMQLETMKQVNDTLQSEIRVLAKAHMSKNDV